MDKSDTITVAVSHREEIRAVRADIYLSAKASVLITGDAAFQKAKELAHVVSQLTGAGIKEEEITLRGVLAERTNPIIGPGNPATYLLRVHCPRLDRLPELLVVITAQRNVILDQLVWLFPDSPTEQAKWLTACLTQALEKARHIAANLGVKLLGVHSFSEKWIEPNDDQKRVEFSSSGGTPLPKGSTDRNAPITIPLVTTKQVEIDVEVNFRVSAYE
jgi:hypothetical protein